MSFNTGGHIVYLTAPKKSSTSHAMSEANGSLVVFTEVPSGVEAIAPEGVGTIVPEPLLRGRVVG